MVATTASGVGSTRTTAVFAPMGPIPMTHGTPAGLASGSISGMRNETIPFLLITSKVVLRQIQSAQALLPSRRKPCQPILEIVQPRQEIFSYSLAARWTMD